MTSQPAVFSAEGCKDTPFWRPQPAPSVDRASKEGGIADGPLSAFADVLIIGAGYTGLAAAVTTARGGRRTVVVDAASAGWGCSTRNGGQVSTSIKPTLGQLARKFGHERGRRILMEGRNARRWVEDFIAREKIDCGFRRCGRFHGAHNARALEKLCRQIESEPDGLESGAWPVARGEQRGEIGSDFYHGGAVFPHVASVDPARYHHGLLRCAKNAGAEIVTHCAAHGIRREGRGFTVATARGTLRAREVVVATNGYTGRVVPWLRRRVIPVGTYIIATEELDAARIKELLPTGRVVTDTRKLVYYYRASPDGRRLLFGGRVLLKESAPMASAPRLFEAMTRIFPQLKDVRVTHCWGGTVAFTFDALPHCGRRGGVHYAMGYCGSGVSLASYFGMRAGQKILGLREGETALDGLPFPARFWYAGRPWFLAPAVSFYRWRDRMGW